MSYTPRPGSKTEAAVNFIRSQGGSALARDIAEAIDADRKNLPALFTAAIAGGLLEAWDLPNGAGYCVCGSPAPGAAAAKAKTTLEPTPAIPPAETRGEALARELQVAKAIPARRSRSMAQKPKVIAAADLPKAKKLGRTNSVPPPVTQAMRCGMFNDGTLRIEAGDAEATVRFFEENSDDAVITFTPAAAAVLIDYIRRMPS